MLNRILYKNTLGYTGRSGSSSTSSRSSTSNTSNTSSTNTSTTGDNYAQYITYQNGVPVVIVSDGTYSVALVLEELTSRGEKKYTVPEALNNFFRVYWTYDDFLKMVTRDKNNTVHATGPRSDSSVWHEGDDKKKYAEIAKQNQIDAETRNNAISSGNAITLGDLLKSVKNKIVYVRTGYVYIGNSLEPAPKASTGDAASATKFLDDKGTGGNGGDDSNIITVGNDEEDSDIWWLLLPVVIGGAYLLRRKKKKRK